MSGPIITIERPEIIHSHNHTSSRHSDEQLALLYDEYDPIVRDFARAMHELHGRYIRISGPAVLELASRVAHGGFEIMDDFVHCLQGNSQHLSMQAKQIEEEFQRQKRTACAIARLAR
jgi:hypothetical protein